MRVALFITCFNDSLFPQTGRAVVRLPERLGVTRCGCCGWATARCGCCGRCRESSWWSCRMPSPVVIVAGGPPSG